MKVSIGIITCEKNITPLLKSINSQNLRKVIVSEIIIVSLRKNKDIFEKQVKEECVKTTLLFEDFRKGKYSAINLFLKQAKEEILIQLSGDIVLDKNFIYNITKPLKNKKVGIVGSRPIPLIENSPYYLSFATQLLWKLHHDISKKEPKFGEAISFRNLISHLPKTAVDEEMIAYLIKEKGYLSAYSEKAIVINKPKKTLSDFILQRRRVFCGHMQLFYQKNYKVATLDTYIVFKKSLKYINRRDIFFFLVSLFLELSSRIFGFFDFITKKDYSIWKINEDTTSNSFPK